jgi:O-antigen/teichoic acid export membrane protein
VEFIAYSFFCLQSIPGMKHPQWPKLVYLKKLLGFGGWLTVTNIVGPLMTYMDRFIVGGIVSMTAVAYYATPYDFVSRLAVIPGSLLGVMFPALSASFALDRGRFRFLYNKSVTYILWVMTPIVLIFTVAAHPFLNAWLGSEFAAQSTLVFQLLAVGTLINAIGQVPYSAIQAMGRPDITAKIHLLELLPYLAMIWVLALKMGIAGAALAWLIRVVFDTAVLYLIAKRMMRHR